MFLMLSGHCKWLSCCVVSCVREGKTAIREVEAVRLTQTPMFLFSVDGVPAYDLQNQFVNYHCNEPAYEAVEF